jgi:hypothetical protein
MTAKTYEQRLADLVRRLASNHDGEVIAAASALKRLLASRDADLNDLGSAIEKLATGGLEEVEMKRLFEAGRAQGLKEARREHGEADATTGLRPDGSKDWEAIALYCQRETARLRSEKEREFVNDMAGRLTFPEREPTERQAAWLLSIFRRLGGRIG